MKSDWVGIVIDSGLGFEPDALVMTAQLTPLFSGLGHV
jgi:hypothetical protein